MRRSDWKSKIATLWEDHAMTDLVQKLGRKKSDINLFISCLSMLPSSDLNAHLKQNEEQMYSSRQGLVDLIPAYPRAHSSIVEALGSDSVETKEEDLIEISSILDIQETPVHTLSKDLEGLTFGDEQLLTDLSIKDRMTSKDLVGLLDYPRQSALDIETLATLVGSAAEMRNIFDDLKRDITESESGTVAHVDMKSSLSNHRSYTTSSTQFAFGSLEAQIPSEMSLQASDQESSATRKNNISQRMIKSKAQSLKKAEVAQCQPGADDAQTRITASSPSVNVHHVHAFPTNTMDISDNYSPITVYRVESISREPLTPQSAHSSHKRTVSAINHQQEFGSGLDRDPKKSHLHRKREKGPTSRSTTDSHGGLADLASRYFKGPPRKPLPLPAPTEIES
ncbi:putative Fungal N-terminal domain-containing protein [Seiridium unicorne]|uniref:Fungal N-terminal domain-containing protein n=1 Tax=Seiridium unicorne TaxID=138068 RepID=A0ABR2UZT4_9PEZI